ncbi:MAG: FAD-dependent oxidoreductase [Oligoflexales bacterium]|nr:FAD-dependent oxidoreductase [Oligoflexales bacterium]
MHDLVSRGWCDVVLLEKGVIGSGSSSKSTKLIHGGFKNLKNIRDITFISESLRERNNLLRLARDIVHPIELYIPMLKEGSVPPYMIKAGLVLYDLLAGRGKIKPHRKVSREQLEKEIPILSTELFSGGYFFWDAQTDDLALVRRVAESAVRLGGKIFERCLAKSVKAIDDGWLVDVEREDGTIHTISALYVVNALGSWSNFFLENNKLKPIYRGINSEGTHVLLNNIDLNKGLLLQDLKDKRFFYVVPWFDYTIVGTTEKIFREDPEKMAIRSESVNELLSRFNQFFKVKVDDRNVVAAFSGLRWLKLDDTRDIASTSRSYAVSEHQSSRGLLLTLYGGKLTTYRSLAEKIGDRITSHFGEWKPSGTLKEESWVGDITRFESEKRLLDRFVRGGPAFVRIEV